MAPKNPIASRPWLALIGLLLPACATGARPGAAPLLDTVRTLASPEFGGRLAGTAGYDRAAAFAADRFRALGLRPAGDDGFFQRLTLETNEIDACGLALPGGAGLTLGRDYLCRGFTGSGTFTAPVVFAGYGLSFPEQGYDDYAAIDVRGKVVLVFKDPPAWTLDAAGWGAAPLPRPKARVAESHGAVGLLMVSPPSAKARAPIGSVLHGEGTQPLSLPQLHVAPAVAERLLAGSGTSLEDLQRDIDGQHRPRSLALAGEVAIDVRARYRADGPTENVVAILEGLDPALRDEYVVIGAHLDHVGTQIAPGGERVLFPGANDDASGTAAVLGIAQEFGAARRRPKRSIVFVLFASEEQGTLGSRYFVEHAPVPLDRIVAMLNLDCIGHGSGQINLGSGKSFPALHALVLRQARNGEVGGDTWFGGGPAAEPFFARGVPTAYFHTADSYTHLHLPSDSPDTLRPDLLARTARLAYRAAREIARGRYRREMAVPDPKATSK
jgi:aminopeptidase YwaD